MVEKLLQRWAKLHSLDYSLQIAPKYIQMVNQSKLLMNDLSSWTLRKCDRTDYKDWMPYKVKKTNHVTVYYVNVNPGSPVHNHSLNLTLQDVKFSLTEWDGMRIISSVPAVVESHPTNVSEDELLEFSRLLNKN